MHDIPEADIINQEGDRLEQNSYKFQEIVFKFNKKVKLAIQQFQGQDQAVY